MQTLVWSRLDDLIKTHKIIIVHPKDKPHPRHPEMVFPLDYGYLEGTSAMDGGGIDVWLGKSHHRRLYGGYTKKGRGD